MKRKIDAFDFTRAISMICIILFHFSCHTQSKIKPLYLHANGNWGAVFVSIFFMLSGGLIYLNNNETSLKSFYYKRWKSIFPVYYIAYILGLGGKYILHFLTGISIVHVPLKYYLFSLMGIDGYLSLYGINVHNIVGDWFVGAIIICYLLTPILIRISKKNDILLLIPLLIPFFFEIYSQLLPIDTSKSIVTSLLCMQLGIILIKRNLWKNRLFLILSIAIIAFLSVIKLPVNETICTVILGICLFTLLTNLGQYVMKFNIINRVVTKLSIYSYAIFLVHHVVIVTLLEFVNSDNSFVSVIELLVILFISILSGFFLFEITKRLLKTKLFTKMESRMINND